MNPDEIHQELLALRRGEIPPDIRSMLPDDEVARHAYLRERRRQVEMALEMSIEEADQTVRGNGNDASFEDDDPDGEDEIPTYNGEIMPPVPPNYLTHKLYLARFIDAWQINVLQRSFGGSPYAVLRIGTPQLPDRQPVTIIGPSIKAPCVVMDDHRGEFVGSLAH